ncbi:hypothetical protein [Cellulomonas sp. PhB150]|uniref:hypothetical protein n=1 Tax=Cellulomonas sp. PhB150 TaxID=2485188 RepID=UPI000F49E048|nr:hypothetical protein [Cellulomonas sp. PhB150]
MAIAIEHNIEDRTHEAVRARREARRDLYVQIARELVTRSSAGSAPSELIEASSRQLGLPPVTVAELYWEMVRRGLFDLDGKLTGTARRPA